MSVQVFNTRFGRGEPVLFLAGFCLILLQFFMIREMTALLRGTEIVILLVSISYFSGFSIGYGLSGFLSIGLVRKLAALTWIVHLTLPFSLRYLSGYLIDSMPSMAFVASLFLMAFILSSFFSVLLPRFIDQPGAGPDSLIRYYGTELAGALAGIAAIFFLGGVSPMSPPVMYQAALALLVTLLLARRYLWALTGAGFVLYVSVFWPLERASLSYYYEKTRHFPSVEMLYSVNSPYQKVDIFRSGSGRKYIYLDGAQYYGSSSLSVFNVFLSKLPAQLVSPKKTLIIGSGSMESVRHVSEFSGQVTTVEIDAAVTDGSMRHLAEINRLDAVKNWRLVIGDGKQFLGGADELYDLIIVDVPAPLTIQVGLLHSVEFYALAKKRLTPKGVISVSLSGGFRPESPTPRTVAAGLASVFEEMLICTAGMAGRSFAVAGRSIPFTGDDMRETIASYGAEKIEIFDKERALEIIGDTEPISIDNISYPVKRSLRRVRRSFFR